MGTGDLDTTVHEKQGIDLDFSETLNKALDTVELLHEANEFTIDEAQTNITDPLAEVWGQGSSLLKQILYPRDLLYFLNMGYSTAVIEEPPINEGIREQVINLMLGIVATLPDRMITDEWQDALPKGVSFLSEEEIETFITALLSRLDRLQVETKDENLNPNSIPGSLYYLQLLDIALVEYNKRLLPEIHHTDRVDHLTKFYAYTSSGVYRFARGYAKFLGDHINNQMNKNRHNLQEIMDEPTSELLNYLIGLMEQYADSQDQTEDYYLMSALNSLLPKRRKWSLLSQFRR